MMTTYRLVGLAVWLACICPVMQGQHTLFVMNFSVNGEKQTKMGQTVAGIIEKGLSCCGCRYSIVQRFSVDNASTPGASLQQELATKQVDYLLQGDLNELPEHSNLYQLDYRIEERQTMSTIAVGTFKVHLDALLTAPSCETALAARLSLDNGLCKNKLLSPQALVGENIPLPDSGKKDNIRDELGGDSDGDGVINALDVEPYTPAGAMVDRSGRAVDPASFVYLKKVKEELLQDLPAFPEVTFEAEATVLPVTAQAALAQALTWLQRYPNMVVSIEGHDPTDAVRAYDRAKAVRAWFVKEQSMPAQRFRLRYDVNASYKPNVHLSFDLNATKF